MATYKSKQENKQPLEKKLWASADKLRKNMDAAEYKHIVLGLIFLKYISDAFEEKRASLQREFENPKSEWYIKEPEARWEALNEREEYRAENVFYVPKQARWPHLQSVAKQPEIGKYLDDAMAGVEKENTSLKGVLPKVYARPNLDKASLGSLIDLIGTMTIGDAEARSQDLLGRVYEYFLGQFALAPRGARADNFTHPRASLNCWWKCWNRTKAGCSTRAAAPAACLCRARNS